MNEPTPPGPAGASGVDGQPGPVVAVVGATAAGKSELALDLAERCGGEVVNTDSMQVYRGMDVGTAKLPPAHRRGITHHLLDSMEVGEDASVAVFQAQARAVVARCRGRGVVPVLVGGSALYTRAVLDDLEFPGTDPELRGRLEDDLSRVGPAAMHARLAQLDPQASAAIEPGNGRRTVRALEVGALTGRPFAATLPAPTYVDPRTVQIGVEIDRPTLDARIERRVEQMWRDGLVEEVRRLGPPLRESRTASRALGYAQVLAFLAGQCTEQEAKERTVVGTRRFARKQESWFRRDDRITWVPFDAPDRLERALAVVQAARLAKPS